MTTLVIPKPSELSETATIQPLLTVIEQIGIEHVSYWALRKITFMSDNSPFGLTVPDIENLSKEMTRGFTMADVDFRVFLTNGIQMIDGYIDGYAKLDDEPFFQIECLDSSQWEISTLSEDLAAKLKKDGFKIKDKINTPDSKLTPEQLH